MPFDNAPWKDPVTERIERASACLEERGWCQRGTSDSDGRVCLLGAFMYSDSNGRVCLPFMLADWLVDEVTKDALRRVARAAGCGDQTTLWRWNDSLLALTGKWAVLDVLRRAAAEVG